MLTSIKASTPLHKCEKCGAKITIHVRLCARCWMLEYEDEARKTGKDKRPLYND